jgi:hypothetical protein
MNKHDGRKYASIIILLLLGSWFLLACSPTAAEPTPTLSAPTSTASSAPLSTQPIETPEQTTPVFTQHRVVFVAGPDADPVLTEQIAVTISELAAAENLEFEQLTSFSQHDSLAEIKILAAVGQDPGLAAMAETSPFTQFLSINIPGTQPASNLTVIDDQEISPADVGFVAGYLAAVASPEWRVGVISSSDSPTGIAQRQGFINGVVYFCGLCRQTYPPFNTYPMYVESPSTSSPSEWLLLADTLINNAVETVFISPGVGDESLQQYLADAGINIIATTSPLPGYKERWIAIINPDFSAVIRTIWPDLMSGQGGNILSAPLTFSDPNYNLFSSGRQHLVEKMLAELSSGFIDTGVANTSDS